MRYIYKENIKFARQIKCIYTLGSDLDPSQIITVLSVGVIYDYH